MQVIGLDVHRSMAVVAVLEKNVSPVAAVSISPEMR